MLVDPKTFTMANAYEGVVEGQGFRPFFEFRRQA